MTHNENQALCERVKGWLILYSDAHSMMHKWLGCWSLEVFSKVTDAMSSQIQPATTHYYIPHLLIPSILLSKDPRQGGWVINNTTSPTSYITDEFFFRIPPDQQHLIFTSAAWGWSHIVWLCIWNSTLSLSSISMVACRSSVRPSWAKPPLKVQLLDMINNMKAKI